MKISQESYAQYIRPTFPWQFFLDREPCSKAGHASFWKRPLVKENLSILFAHTSKLTDLPKEKLVCVCGALALRIQSIQILFRQIHNYPDSRAIRRLFMPESLLQCKQLLWIPRKNLRIAYESGGIWSSVNLALVSSTDRTNDANKEFLSWPFVSFLSHL